MGDHGVCKTVLLYVPICRCQFAQRCMLALVTATAVVYIIVCNFTVTKHIKTTNSEPIKYDRVSNVKTFDSKPSTEDDDRHRKPPRFVKMKTAMVSTLAASSRERMRSKQLSQQEVINCLTNGAWQKQDYTREEGEEIRSHMRKTRDQYGMPRPLQRKDLKCGRMSLGPGKLNWYRAVCDPDYTTPCCYKAICRNKTEEECRCEGCIDLRQELHAEYSRWQNEDPYCQVKTFDSKQACEVVNGTRFVFIGDSHTRNMYRALQLLLTGNDVTRSMESNITKNELHRCQGLGMFTEPVCKIRLRKENSVCGDRVLLKLHVLFSSAVADKILKVVYQLVGQPGSFLVIGVGHHDAFRSRTVIGKVTGPVMRIRERSKSTWPKIIWMGGHSMSLIKMSLAGQPPNPHVLKFNAEMSAFLKKHQATFLNPFNLTKNLASHDGCHYGRGASMLKARVLIDFIHRVHSYS